MLSKEEGLYLHRLNIKRTVDHEPNYQRVLRSKDYENGLEKMGRAALVGMALNSLFGVVKYLCVFPMPMSHSIAFSLDIILKGASAGVLYVTTSTTTSVVRGYKDSPLNHFAAGFVTTLYIAKPPFVYGKIVRSTIVGAYMAFVKFALMNPIPSRTRLKHIEEGVRRRDYPFSLGQYIKCSTAHHKKDIEHLENFM